MPLTTSYFKSIIQLLLYTLAEFSSLTMAWYFSLLLFIDRRGELFLADGALTIRLMHLFKLIHFKFDFSTALRPYRHSHATLFISALSIYITNTTRSMIPTMIDAAQTIYIASLSPIYLDFYHIRYYDFNTVATTISYYIGLSISYIQNCKYLIAISRFARQFIITWLFSVSFTGLLPNGRLALLVGQIW